MILMMILFVISEAFKGIRMDILMVPINGFFVAVHPDFDFLVVAALHSSQIMMSQKPGPEDDMMAMIYILTYLYSGMLFIVVSGFLLLLHGSSWLASAAFLVHTRLFDSLHIHKTHPNTVKTTMLHDHFIPCSRVLFRRMEPRREAKST